MPQSHPSSEVVELPNAGWDARLRIFRSRGGEVDTCALVTERYVVLVDTATLPAISASILEAVRPALVGRGLLVVVTHADYDHAWGNATFAADGLHPAPICGSVGCRERLLGAEARERLAAMAAEDAAFAGVRLVPPSVTFAGELWIHGGDLTLALLPTPGHTADHSAVWAPEIRLALVGDAAEHPFPVVADAASVPALRASLRRLVALDPMAVIPCHGGTTDPGLLARNLAYFDELERRVHVARGDARLPDDWATREDLPDALGLPFEEAVRAAGARLEGMDAMYRRFHLRNARAMVGWALGSERRD